MRQAEERSLARASRPSLIGQSDTLPGLAMTDEANHNAAAVANAGTSPADAALSVGTIVKSISLRCAGYQPAVADVFKAWLLSASDNDEIAVRIQVLCIICANFGASEPWPNLLTRAVFGVSVVRDMEAIEGPILSLLGSLASQAAPTSQPGKQP